MRTFPVFMIVQNRTIVIFGGGTEAAAKLRLVQKTKAKLILVACELESSEIEFKNVKWVKQDPLQFKFPEDTVLAYTATGNMELDAKIASNARMKGIVICAADQPEVSDFITPAIVDRDPVVVAIGTEGNAPVLARLIKAEIEKILPSTLGLFARIASSLRSMVSNRLPSGRLRRIFWKRLFIPVLSGRPICEDKFLQRAENLFKQKKQQENGLVSFVDVKCKSIDLLPLKALKRLDQADVVIHNFENPSKILELARREAIFIRTNKTYTECYRLDKQSNTLINLILLHVRTGKHMVLLMTNDLITSSKTHDLLLALREEKIFFEIVPGINTNILANMDKIILDKSDDTCLIKTLEKNNASSFIKKQIDKAA